MNILISIVEQAFIALPLIMGAYITLSLLKVPDFSLESAYLFGAVAAFLAKGLPMPFVFLSALLGGMLVAVTVSSINQILRIPYLLAAIVTNGLFHGFTQYVLSTSFVSFHLSHPLQPFILLPLLAIGLIVGLTFILNSQLGYSFAIYGNNPHFFKNHKMSGSFVVSIGVALGHGLAGISGFLFAESNGFVDLTMNYGIILLCLTALMVGKLLMRTHYPNILVPLLGILAYFLIQQSLLQLGFNLKYFNAVQAFFILSILAIGARKKNMTLDHLGV